MAVGQAIGVLGAVWASWGWDVAGPPRAALSSDAATEQQLLATSLRVRLATCSVIAPLVVVVAVATSPSGELGLTIASALAGLTGAASPVWYLVGKGRASTAVLFDTMPRTLSALLAAVLIAQGMTPIVYPIVTLVAVIGSYALFYGTSLASGSHRCRIPLMDELRHGSSAAAIAIISTFYSAAAVPLVQLSAPLAAPEFASSYRLLTYWNFATIVTGNALQRWVFETPQVEHRRSNAFALLLAQGLILGAALAWLGPWVSRLLFGQELTAPPETYFLFGFAYCVICVATWANRLVLLPQQLERPILLATTIAAFVGPIVIVFASRSFGVTGGAAGVVIAEVSILIIVLRAAHRAVGKVFPSVPSS